MNFIAKRVLFSFRIRDVRGGIFIASFLNPFDFTIKMHCIPFHSSVKSIFKSTEATFETFEATFKATEATFEGFEHKTQ